MDTSYCTYVSTGSRSFGDNPMAPGTRPTWEFYAVLAGEMAPLGESGKPTKLSTKTLWIFPPGHLHGWIGRPRKTSHVAVFHFVQVPPDLETQIAPRGYATYDLDPADLTLLSDTARELMPHYGQASKLLKFHSLRALMTLSLLVMSKIKPELKPREKPAKHSQVEVKKRF